MSEVESEAKMLQSSLLGLFTDPDGGARKTVAKVVELATKVDYFCTDTFLATMDSPDLRQSADAIQKELDAEVDALALHRPPKGDVKQAEEYVAKVTSILNHGLARYEGLREQSQTDATAVKS
ncbi:MAG: hypothetical protein JRN21_09635 [Nitrososphaerota archaeon]|nr:hypothetical protein [Nitrososphaerota archaeon]